MIRTFRSLAVALVLTAAAFVRPPAAAAQPVEICSGQAVPSGYVVTAATNRPACPGYYSGQPYNSLTISLPGEQTTVCSALSTAPQGYAVIAATNRTECPGYYSGQPYNSLTLRLPGETITVCSALTSALQGYVVTAQGSRTECPGYYSGNNNSATYRRIALPPAAQAPPAAPAHGALAVLDAYARTASLRLEEMEEWLGLTEPTHEPWRGELYQGAHARAELQVQAGMRYTVVAVCDDDCTDMDLRVMDGSYGVAQDVEMEAYARVELAPTRDGTLRVEPVLAACQSSPCRFVVGVYATPAVSAAPAGRPPIRERIRRPPVSDVRPAPQQWP